MNEHYKPDIILVENKASGQSLIPELQLMGFPVVPFNPQEWGDKVMRANSVTPYFRNGRIWVPDSQSFSSMIMKDALEFPFGSSDDLVDTMTQTIIHLRQTMTLSTQDHMSEDLEPDEDMYHRRRKTYWSAASRG
jgi:phage terminase large subunit-like protein